MPQHKLTLASPQVRVPHLPVSYPFPMPGHLWPPLPRDLPR